MKTSQGLFCNNLLQLMAKGLLTVVILLSAWHALVAGTARRNIYSLALSKAALDGADAEQQAALETMADELYVTLKRQPNDSATCMALLHTVHILDYTWLPDNVSEYCSGFRGELYYQNMVGYVALARGDMRRAISAWQRATLLETGFSDDQAQQLQAMPSERALWVLGERFPELLRRKEKLRFLLTTFYLLDFYGTVPNDPFRGWLQMGEETRPLDNAEKTLAELKGLVNQRPDVLRYRLLLGDACVLVGRQQDGLIQYEIAGVQWPEHSAVIYRLAGRENPAARVVPIYAEPRE